MKRELTIALALVATISSAALAREGGVNLNINLGAPVVVQPAPPPGPQVVLQTAPRFIFSPALGMYVSVGVPYDIVYIGTDYYVYDNGFWYRGPYYSGPWVRVESRRLPPLLHKYRYDQIRHHRDVEFRRYEKDRDHYRGRWYEPAHREAEHREHKEHKGHGEHGEHGEHENHGEHGERHEHR